MKVADSVLITDRGVLNTVGITKALLEYRNMPHRDIGLSPAELLYVRQLKDFQPDEPNKFQTLKHRLPMKSLRDAADRREKALFRRGIRLMDRLRAL